MSRFLNIVIDDKNLPPINAYWQHSLVSLDQALIPVMSQFNQWDIYIDTAKNTSCYPSEHQLTRDESATIFLYTMERDDNSLYHKLNKVLCCENRQLITPWSGFLQLFHTALTKLPTVGGYVWRGMKGDIREQIKKDEIITWWGITSCSMSLEVIGDCLGSDKNATLLMIEVKNAKDISSYTCSPDKKEVLLIPGTQLRVKGHAMHRHSGLPVIYLTQIYDDQQVQLSTGSTSTTDTIDDDGFDAGQTRHIQRDNTILISTVNDIFAGTVCCHENQLIFNHFDQATQSYRLTLIRDISNLTNKLSITWDEPDSLLNASDDECIQDIVYSDKISGYFILNRSRLRTFKQNNDDLEEYHTFPDRTMKRLTSNDKFIYLTATHTAPSNSGDEIIVMNYDKEEQVCKIFRDIIPIRSNRGTSLVAGEISDIAAGSNDQITVGYRFERRREVGFCIFNISNDGMEWSCVKQLLLNDCWHGDLSYTPRIEWCEKLNAFLLIEYMTGHLIMFDKDGQVCGECLFMSVQNQHESPINLTISTNDWLCVRYESSINIHRITS